MNEQKREFLIDTDVLIDHLTHSGPQESSLEKSMRCGICFTTVINSAEIYFALRNPNEKKAADALMKSLKVLGFNSRYSLSVDQFSDSLDSVRDALFCVTAKINKLNIVTSNSERYSKTGLDVIDPQKL